MADENVGLRCPKCSDGKEVVVFIALTRPHFRLSSDGNVENCSSMEWDENCDCECENCGHSATVSDFRQKSARQMLREVAEKVLESRDTGFQAWDLIVAMSRLAVEAVEQNGLGA